MATILVVDDRCTNREVIKTLLGYAGHRILEAHNGIDGLDIHLPLPVGAEAPRLGITLSLGLAIYPDHGLNIEELLRSADDALYQAKRKGRDCVEVCGKSAQVPVQEQAQLA